jgi:hypothetical protein
MRPNLHIVKNDLPQPERKRGAAVFLYCLSIFSLSVAASAGAADVAAVWVIAALGFAALGVKC